MAAGDAAPHNVSPLFGRWLKAVDWVAGLDADSPPILDHWRRRVFAWLLLAGLILGLFIYVPSVILVWGEGHYSLVLLDTLGYAVMAGVTLGRRLPFGLRAGLVAVLCYLLGVVLMVKIGPQSGAPVWMFMFPIVAGTMLGVGRGLAAVIVNLLTLGALTWVLATGGMPWSVGLDLSLQRWTVFCVNFLLLNAMAALAVAVLLRGLSSTLREERAARVELARERERLAESHKRYQSLVEGVPYGMFLAAADSGRLLFLNEEGRRMFGFREGEALGATLWDAIDPAERDAARDQMADLLAGRLPPRQHLAYTGRRQDGESLRFEVVCSVVSYQDQTVIQGVLKDITERERLELQLQQSQKMEAVGALAAGAAHEFNNLLAALGGYNQLLGLMAEMPLQAREYLDKIDSCVRQGSEMTQAMLSFVRPDQPEMRAVDLGRVLREMRLLLQRSLGPGVVLHLEIPGGPATVHGNPGQIEQILLNLALNAGDAMPRGGRLTMGLSDEYLDETFARANPWARPGPYRRLEVADTGEGMLREVRERLFEPFFTTKPSGRGTGLGLSVVYNLIRRHGGGVEVNSAPGEGARFVIHLPAVDPPAESEPHKPPAPERERPAEDRPLRVLVVDDEPVLRDIACRSLELYRHRTDASPDGRAALEMYRRALEAGDPYDVVLLDLAMPVMDGWDCLDHLVKLDPGVKVVVISGLNEMRLDRKRLDGKVVSILPKPYSLDGLVGEVRRAAAS